MAKILIVDDSSFQRTILKKIINATDHTYEEVDDGKKAIDKFSSDEFDLIFLDLLMPGITGFEVLKELNKVKPHIPAIVITADIQDSVKTECLELGAKRFLNKPVNKEEVMMALSEILN